MKDVTYKEQIKIPFKCPLFDFGTRFDKSNYVYTSLEIFSTRRLELFLWSFARENLK